MRLRDVLFILLALGRGQVANLDRSERPHLRAGCARGQQCALCVELLECEPSGGDELIKFRSVGEGLVALHLSFETEPHFLHIVKALEEVLILSLLFLHF